MEPETEKILENLRETRISRKISLLNLANKVEISHSHLYYIESKKVIPSIDVIIKLAKALEINPRIIVPDIKFAPKTEYRGLAAEPLISRKAKK